MQMLFNNVYNAGSVESMWDYKSVDRHWDWI